MTVVYFQPLDITVQLLVLMKTFQITLRLTKIQYAVLFGPFIKSQLRYTFHCLACCSVYVYLLDERLLFYSAFLKALVFIGSVLSDYHMTGPYSLAGSV